MSSVAQASTQPPKNSDSPSFPKDVYTPGTPIRARGEEWLVQEISPAGEHWFVTAVGTSGIARDQVATFYTALEDVTTLDPSQARVITDSSNKHLDAKLWLDAVIRRSPVPMQHTELVHIEDSLVDPLTY